MLRRLTDYSLRWSPNRRLTAIAIGLACLLALAAATAFLTGRDDHPDTAAPVPSPAPSSAAPTSQPSTWSGPVAGPPKISDPVQFAKAAAKMLWSYDTRTASQAQQLTGMRAWMTEEDEYGDWASVSAQIPDPVLWSRMADQEQHATATIAEGHYPSAFKQALAEDPAAITKAYIYAVTVTGKQTITWANGGTGAEDRSVTLAVQCRPSTDCSLVAIAPRVAP
ncbi:hypothetical protein [Streptomyces sp. NPDC051132]|uniref:hypothetical protein n=1 Tax=unclassified Streptomyces TaxID=2593676 RepID=UPI0034333EFC